MRNPALLSVLCVVAGCSGEQQASVPNQPLGPPAIYAEYKGDPQAGRRVFRQCVSCHSLKQGENHAGPSLYGVVGKRAGQAPNFRYSKANSNSGIIWTEEKLFSYLQSPRTELPGTTMGFDGLASPQDRADLIALLKSNAEKG